MPCTLHLPQHGTAKDAGAAPQLATGQAQPPTQQPSSWQAGKRRSTLSLLVDAKHGLVTQLLALQPLLDGLGKETLQRVIAVRWRGVRQVLLRLLVPHQHRLHCVVLADAAELGGVLKLCGEELGEEVKHADDAVHERDGHGEEVLLLAGQAEQHLGLLPRGERLAGAADGQHLVHLVARLHAVSDEGGEVRLADGLARGQGAVTEHDVRLALLHQLDLARQRLEECGGAHDGVRDVARRLQLLFELELGALELEQRLLHADGRQQHKVRCALLAAHVQAVLGGGVVDQPAVFLAACAAGQAGHHHVHLLLEGHRADALLVQHAAKAHFSARQLLLDVILAQLALDTRILASECHHIVTPLHKLAGNKLADVSSASNNKHTDILGVLAAEVILGSCSHTLQLATG
mmetsp:Transcript_25892/g.65868  ORF Transcript_25892/g.65868 Transcript_25892/m.65868 type:complete len:405 (+) Transcript_25892:1311-2525(+)